jgi:ribose 5-phosphate isomerase B
MKGDCFKKMIVIGSDHGGFELKTAIKGYLEEKGYNITDCGVFTPDSVDYPDIAGQVCTKLLSDKAEFGILICGTGIGISIAANKIKGIRAALLCSTYSAKMAREHNNANVICFGGRTTTFEQAKQMLDAFLNAKFQAGRHKIRVDKIMEMEE